LKDSPVSQNTVKTQRNIVCWPLSPAGYRGWW